MFKCKVTDADYLGNSVDLARGKNLAKSAIKKLKNTPDTKTPFYLTLDYYKDDNKKSLGHFLALGTSPKLKKHFETKELKGKGLGADAKSVACGEAYVKVGEKGPVFVLVPHSKVKMTKSKWAAFFKNGSIKPLLAGMKYEIELPGGGSVSEETEETGDETTDTTTEETGGMTGGEDQGTEAPEGTTEETGEQSTLTAEDALKAVDAFNKGPWAAFLADKKSAKLIAEVGKAGQDLIAELDEAGLNDPNVQKAKASVQAKLDKLKPLLDKVGAAQSEASNQKLDQLGGDISTRAQELMNQYKEQISQIEGLEDALKALGQK